MDAAELAATITVGELEADPYPLYAALRRDLPVAWVPAVELWLVTRWDDVEHVARSPAAFTAEVASSPVDACFGSPTIITCDGDRHRELRRGIDPKYRPAQVNGYIDQLVRPLAESLLDDLGDRSGAELMAEYFEPISALTLARSLGFADVDVHTLRRWFRGLSDGATNFEGDPAKRARGEQTAAEIRARADGLLDRIEHEPDDSALSHLLHTGVTPTPNEASSGVGGCRAREFVMPTVLVTLLGGMQEPGHGAGSVLVGLLDHPEQLAEVSHDLSGMTMAAVDEGLRWVAPIGTQTRQASHDVEVAGVTIPAGQAVAAVLASACHDESRFVDAATFDLHRGPFDQAAFGFGGHYCSGHWFARHQIRIALEVLLERHPQLAYAPGFHPRFRGWEFRAPTELHVIW